LSLDRHCIFAVALPYGPGGGISVARTLLSSLPDADVPHVALGLTDTQQFEADFWLGVIGLNVIRSGGLGDLNHPVGWRLFEQEGLGTSTGIGVIDLVLGGTLPAAVYTYCVVDVTAGGDLPPSVLIAQDLSAVGGVFKNRLNLGTPGSTVTARKIYRDKTNGGTTYHLLATVTPAATTYEDNLSHAAFAATSPAQLAAVPANSFLTARLNGVEIGTQPGAGMATGRTHALQLGGPTSLGEGWWGQVKAVLVYAANPTASEKAQIRRHLNNAYQIY
jgi:hypothetical protein